MKHLILLTRKILCPLSLVGILLSASCKRKTEVKMTEEEAFLKSGIELTTIDPLLAIHSLTRAIHLNPKLAIAYRYRAMALIRVGNYDVAEADLKKTIELEGESPVVLRLRAEIQTACGRSEDAIATLTRAIELDPNSSFIHAERAGLKEAYGDMEGASQDYTQALQLDTARDNLGIYHESRARIRERMGDVDGALADYTEAIGSRMRNTFYLGEPHFRRGSILFGKRSFKAAQEDFRAAASTCREGFGFPACVHIWLARSMSGERSEADAELSGFLDSPEAATYLDADTKRFLEFLLGRLPESDFLKDISQTAQSTLDVEALRVPLVWFYAGTKHALDGDIMGAVGLWKKAVAAEPKSHVPDECRWARLELARLKQ